jgi:endonuclease YncB( thermonuclease family)
MSRFVRMEPPFLQRRRQQSRRLATSTLLIGLVFGSAIGFLIWQKRAQWPDVMSAPWTRSRSTALPADLSPNGRYTADVLRVSDGDTFEARVHLWPGHHLITRVRLRGIDTPEMSARCDKELRLAEAAQATLRKILAERQVTIWNIGPDKYGRIVADAATRGTPDISAALLAKGVARKYSGGHRDGWC